MLIDKTGKIITDLDFRGTKTEYLDKLKAREILQIISVALQTVNKIERFAAKDLVPANWEKSVYAPIFAVCGDKKEASKLLSVIVKQALIMSPLPFRHEGSADQWDLTVYTRI